MRPAPGMFERWVERPEYDTLGLPSYSGGAYSARRELVKCYAWAVPDDGALDAIATLEIPVVEIGAGLGYWRSLLAARGVRGLAFDREPGQNFWCEGTPFTEVYPGDHRALEHFARWHKGSHALMLCWPPMSDMAAECVKAFQGDTLIYVGEDEGGCTADDDFFELVREGTPWENVATIDIPQWPGVHDRLWIWRR
jgi:hypothetical protein